MQFVNIQEKRIKINNLNISYKQIGNGNIPIILLHGWGIDSDKYVELIKILSNNNPDYKIYVPDLPGFGKSEEPKEDWDLDSYVNFIDSFSESATRKKGFELVKNILKNFNAKKAVYKEEKEKIFLIGHSFGGRIAIKYAVKYPEKIEKMILTGAAGIKHKLNRKQKVFFFLAKIGKFIFSFSALSKFEQYAKKILYKITKEKDYHNASPKMKKVMKNVLAEDLTPILEKIKIPTLLVWGKLDNSTPLSDGELMREKIKNSKIIIMNDANHSLPYKNPKEFTKIISEYIKK